MIFDGGRDHDKELHPPLNREWLARTAEIDGSWWLAPEPISRHYGMYAVGVVGVLCIAGLVYGALLVVLP